MTRMECETLEIFAQSLNIGFARKVAAHSGGSEILLFQLGAPETAKIFQSFWDAMLCLVLMPGRQASRNGDGAEKG